MQGLAASFGVTRWSAARYRTLGDDLARQRVGDFAGRAVRRARALDDLVDGLVDVAGFFAGFFGVVAGELLRDVDEAAGVDGVVGGVDDVAAHELMIDGVRFELVVGGAGHRPAAQTSNRRRRDRATQRTGGEDVA